MREYIPMNRFVAKLHTLIQSDKVQTAFEFGLIAGGISLGIVSSLFAFDSIMQSVSTQISAKQGGN